MRLRAIALACAAGMLLAVPARAQVFESVGTRAAGMGGAFVAVADDATATFWNPAGLVHGPLVDVALQRSVSAWDPEGSASARSRTETTFFSFALPSLGVNYLRFHTFQLPSPTAPGGESREQQRPGVPLVSAFSVDQVGGTLVQSLLPNLVVGTTLKLMRGSFADGPGRTKFDADVGVLGWAGPMRFGLVGRNLARPDFGARLDRQVRAGIAFTPGFITGRTARAYPSLTFSVDADLKRYATPLGNERHVAAGVERWLLARRLGVRGGVNANTTGQARPTATVGASFAVRSGFVLEGQIGRGRDSAARSWSLGGRVSY